jgi:hypothetical protein
MQLTWCAAGMLESVGLRRKPSERNPPYGVPLWAAGGARKEYFPMFSPASGREQNRKVFTLYEEN